MKKFVFLTYNNRSGSTFLSNELNKFSGICTCPEADILITEFLIHPERRLSKRRLKRIKQIILTDVKFRTWGITVDELDNLFRQSGNESASYFFKILEMYKESKKPSAEIILFKGTKLMLLAEKLLSMGIQDIFFIHILRDGRAVYASQKNSIVPGWRKKIRMSNNVIKTAVLWKRFVNLSDVYLKKFPGKFTELRYEMLIRDTHKQVSNITAMIGLNNLNTTENSNLIDTIPEHLKHLHSHINLKPDVNKIDKWRFELEKNEVILFEYMCNDQMASRKYEKVYGDDKFSLSVLKYYTLYLFGDIRNRFLNFLNHRYKSFLRFVNSNRAKRTI